jgi:predicted DNA-binding transcriptional regulator AlpA
MTNLKEAWRQMTDKLLSRSQAAAFLGISDRTLDRQEDIPRIKLTARRIVYKESDLTAYVEARTKASQKAA